MPLPKSKRQAAKEAGLSLHQCRQAMRVAAVPAETFEALVESEHPPTIAKLADLGRAKGSRRKARTVPCPHCGGSGRVPG